MKSAFSSSDVLISGGVQFSTSSPPFLSEGRFLNLRSALSLIFSMGIGGGAVSDVPPTQKMSLGLGHARIMSRERDFEILPSPTVSWSK